MIDKKIDSDGNLVISGGTFAVVDEDDETAQHLEIAMKHLVGEWFLNPRDGLRLFERILNKSYREPQAAREIRRVVTQLHGINRVSHLKLTRDRASRVLNVVLKVITDNAQTLYYERDFNI